MGHSVRTMYTLGSVIHKSQVDKGSRRYREILQYDIAILCSAHSGEGVSITLFCAYREMSYARASRAVDEYLVMNLCFEIRNDVVLSVGDKNW
jgi:hypothetical protein